MACLVEDSRNKPGQHVAKNEWWGSHGIPVVRSKLPFGDYAIMYPRAVDTKRDIYELAMDIDQEHDRFKRECVGARDAGCELTVLVENDDGVDSIAALAEWSESDCHMEMRKRSVAKIGKDPSKARRILGERLAKACMTMESRYGVRFEFCSPGEAAERVMKILEGRSV